MKDPGSDSTWEEVFNSTWSDLPTSGEEGAPAAQVPRPERYEVLRALGSGSIGEVRLVRDRHLGRQVAYKVLRAVVRGNLTAERRFLREAQINARLNHPGIVPVFDAGVQEDGARYYTMRLVKGRSLAEGLAGCAGLGQRLGLMDHYVALVQAMAYAHARGVVHRDLKPANVMIGDYGETQIIDWGLARVKELPEQEEEAQWVDLRDVQVTGTLLGTVLGTPRYMSPEQARGEVGAVDERSDVFSLGAILYELLTGRGPFDGGGTFDVLARVREGQVPPVASVEPGVPTELAAIAEKAMLPDPAQRYSDASALAEDLERWRNGALVGAYAYRTRDHLARFVRQHRGVLAVVGVALAVLGTVGVISADRVVTERNRALQAEQEATARLATSFVLQADAAREAGRWPVAELYAASALVLAEDPVARGVIAGSWARPALRLVGLEAAPEYCEELVRGDGFLACAGPERFSAWVPGQPERPFLSIPGLWSTVAALGDRMTWVGGDEAHLYDAGGALLGSWRGRTLLAATPLGGTQIALSSSKEVRRVELADNSVLWRATLPGVATQLRPSRDGRRLLVSTRTAHAFELDAHTGAVLAQYGPTPSMTGIAIYNEEETQVIVGAGTGEVAVFDRASGEARLRTGQFGASVTGLYALPGLLVVRVENGAVRVYSLGDGRELAALQESDRPRVAVGVNPVAGELWTGGRRGLRRWSVSELDRRSDWILPEGLLDAALSPRGDRLVTLTGLRQAALFSVPDGAKLAEWTARTPPGGRRVIFSANSERVLFGDVGGPLEVRSARDGRLLTELPGQANLLAAAGNRVVGSSGGWVVWDLESGAVLGQTEGPMSRDLDLSADGHTLVWSDRLNEDVHVIVDLAGPQQREWVIQASEPVLGLSVSPDGQRLAWTLMTGDIVLVDPDGTERLRLRGHNHYVQRTAWSADGRRLASAGWDGTARIWDTTTGRELAQLRGHQHRVWSVSWSADGRTLATSSWDRSARLWDLSVLDLEGEALVAAVRERHGLVLDGARAGFAMGE